VRPAAPLLLALLILVGCAVAEAPPAAGLPPVVEQRWVPPDKPRAVILALHGFNDRKAAFNDFGAYAAARGILVEAYDQPGFGARPDRGRWPGTRALVAEAHARVRSLRERHPGLPVFVLGESMGAALVTVAFTEPTAPPVDGVILSAPAVWGGDALSPLYRRTLTIAGLVAPWAKLTGGNLGIQASDNIPALIELGRDPLYIRETRIDAIVGLVEAMDQARDRAPMLAVPTLVLTGARDEVVPPQSQAEFIGFLPAASCAAVTYLDGWHLLLRDLQRERVYADIVAWAESLRLPSGLDRPCGVAPGA
jgi:acylglycerol lipase